MGMAPGWRRHLKVKAHVRRRDLGTYQAGPPDKGLNLRGMDWLRLRGLVGAEPP
jgi:hypothetical protein